MLKYCLSKTAHSSYDYDKDVSSTCSSCHFGFIIVFICHIELFQYIGPKHIFTAWWTSYGKPKRYIMCMRCFCTRTYLLKTTGMSTWILHISSLVIGYCWAFTKEVAPGPSKDALLPTALHHSHRVGGRPCASGLDGWHACLAELNCL